MPTPNVKTSSPKSVPPKEVPAVKTPDAPPPKKRKFKWGRSLLAILLIAGVVSYWKPLVQLGSSWLHQPAGSAVSSAPPANPSPAVTIAPSSGIQANSSNATPAPAAANALASPSASPNKSTPISEAIGIAKSYAVMPPAKAAAILQKQSTEEIIYTMAEMSSSERAHIWSKMDPAKVAETSFQLKSNSDWTEQEIARLQQKVNQIKQQELQQTSSKELALTYSQMPPAAAAKLIDRMLQTDKAKTLAVMKVMDNTVRSQILTIMAQDQTLMESAALIVQTL